MNNKELAQAIRKSANKNLAMAPAELSSGRWCYGFSCNVLPWLPSPQQYEKLLVDYHNFMAARPGGLPSWWNNHPAEHGWQDQPKRKQALEDFADYLENQP